MLENILQTAQEYSLSGTGLQSAAVYFAGGNFQSLFQTIDAKLTTFRVSKISYVFLLYYAQTCTWEKITEHKGERELWRRLPFYPFTGKSNGRQLYQFS